MQQKLIFLFLITVILSCSTKNRKPSLPTVNNKPLPNKVLQDSIIKEHLEKGAWTKGLYSKEWQEEIDKGLAKDSTIAYLWQQKAMPLFKQGKYELGTAYIDKAVQYNRAEWQEYRAFMTCIFSKRYRAAIDDFEDCKAQFGNSYVMDHSYNFYIALSKIQLNEFAAAEAILRKETTEQAQKQGEDWIHHLDVFYLGIAQYEQGKYEMAIATFNRALALYSKFSEALYYKANAIGRLGDREKAIKLTEQAKTWGKQGYTINEDNSLYERYPYQVRWEHWD